MSKRATVVTGSASGLGRAIAEELTRLGDHVIHLDRVAPPTNAGDALLIDLADTGSIAAAVKQMPDSINVICNIAGMHPRSAEGNEIVAVNFLGHRALTRALLPRMSAGSVVLNMASVAGADWSKRFEHHRELVETASHEEGLAWLERHPVAREEGYSVSKEVISAWTVLAAAEWIPIDVRSVAIAPGPVLTDAFTSFRDAIGNPPTPDIDLVGRAASVDEIVPVVAFLVSEQARWINGTTITIDGGLSACRLAGGHEPVRL